jgi:hypothetical protein
LREFVAAVELATGFERARGVPGTLELARFGGFTGPSGINETGSNRTP